MTAVLRVQFYNPENDEQGFINKLVASVDPPFCHCELHLPDNMACSIFMYSEVHYKYRTFSNPAYTCVHLKCTPQHIAALRTLIRTALDSHVKFSTSAMIGSYYGMDMCPDNHTFCSKLVAELLQNVGILPSTLACNVISPSKLYNILLQLPNYIPPQTLHSQTTNYISRQLASTQRRPDPEQSFTIDWSHNEHGAKLSLARRKNN